MAGAYHQYATPVADAVRPLSYSNSTTSKPYTPGMYAPSAAPTMPRGAASSLPFPWVSSFLERTRALTLCFWSRYADVREPLYVSLPARLLHSAIWYSCSASSEGNPFRFPRHGTLSLCTCVTATRRKRTA